MKTFPQFPAAYAHNLALRETENARQHYIARAHAARRYLARKKPATRPSLAARVRAFFLSATN